MGIADFYLYGGKSGGGGGSSTLAGLTDVNITDPTSGESLKYDGSKWVNGTVTTDLPDFIEETSGNIVTVDAAERPAKSLVVAINPVQNLQGYDQPWAGGAGKNKLEVTGTTQTLNGVTFTVNNDGTIKVNGTATEYARFVIGGYILKAGSSVRLNGSPVDGSTSTIALGYQGYGIVSTANSDKVCNRTSQSTDWDNDVYIGVASGYSANNLIFKPMMRLSSVADSTFEPYSNICPISGFTEANIVVSQTIDAEDGTTYPITFPSEAGTVYGGTLDVTNGTLTVTKANIASYDGEILPGAWISDRDVYAEGTTPTTGAQVVYNLATPITYQLTPTEVQMLLGTNNIWADTGEIKELKYIPQTYDDLLKEISGSGTSLPDTWEVSKDSLIINQSPTTFNELGWGCVTPVDYYDTAITWTISGDEAHSEKSVTTYQKENDTPALIASFMFGGNSRKFSIAFSTDPNGINFTADTESAPIKGQLVYNGRTWHYAQSRSQVSGEVEGINFLDSYDEYVYDNIPEAILIDLFRRNGIVFENESNIIKVSNPSTGYLIGGGGEEKDLSDATFRVLSDGTVRGKDFINDEGLSLSSDFSGATSLVDGKSGNVPAPTTEDVNKFLKGDGTWAEAGAPGNWNISKTSLVLQDTGKEVNSLGWYCGNKENYYDTAFTWTTGNSSQSRPLSRSSSKPALIAAVNCKDDIWLHSFIVSTDKEATYFTANEQGNSFEYLGHTWYYSGGQLSYSVDSDAYVTVIKTIPSETFENLEAAAKYLIESSQISFNSGKTLVMSDPSQEYMIQGGGLLVDGSDATFKVDNNGGINGSSLTINGETISDDFVGATSLEDGKRGLVPAPSSSNKNMFLCGNGGWSAPGLDYSMDEQSTGIFWIDEYRTFRKTIKFNAGGPNSVGTIKYDITSLMKDVDALVNVYFHSNVASGPSGTFYSDFKDISRIYRVIEDGTPKWYYYANPGGSDIWYYWQVAVTIEYTKGPIESEIIPITSDATGSVGFYNYVLSNWQSPTDVFKTSGLTNRINQSLSAGGLGVWINDQDGNAGEPRIDGADWVSCSLGGKYIPYCVRFYPNVNNNWLGTSTVYLDFSKDNVHWDTLRKPFAPTGTSDGPIRLPVLTNDKYSYVRVRFLGGTNAGGYANIGCIAGIQVYGI